MFSPFLTKGDVMSAVGYATYFGRKAAELGAYCAKETAKAVWNFGKVCYINQPFAIQTICVAAGLFSAYKLAKSGADWKLDPREIKITDGKKLALAATLAVGSIAVFVNDYGVFRCALKGKSFCHLVADVPNVRGCV